MYSLLGDIIPPSKRSSGTAHLTSLANELFKEGLASSTRSTYAAGQRRFRNFCRYLKCSPVPSTEATLVLFVTHLAETNTAYATIKVYLAAVRQLHVSTGLHAQFYLQLTPRLQQVLRGIKKRQAAHHPTRIRLPITIHIMKKIKEALSPELRSYNNTMLWAACCMAFFGFMRVGEFTIPTKGSYDKTSHLSLSDVSVDRRDNPRLLRVTIKQSKTDPFRRGVNIYLGATNGPICPVRGILPYLAVRGNRQGPLFTTEDGSGLTRQTFATLINPLLSRLNLNTKNYNTHSFRIGAATSAAEAHIPDTYIKMLGRWRSDAYQCYIKTPPHDLAKLSKQLVAHLEH